MANLYKLIKFLLRSSEKTSYSRFLVFVVVFTSVAAGGVSTGLVALINAALQDARAGSDGLALGFIALCILLPTTRFASSYLLVRLSQSITLDLRLRLCRLILSSPLRKLETIGPARLLATLTDDIGRITGTLANVPLLLLQLTVVIGCLVYMAWLSPKVFAVVLVFFVVGVLTYRLPLVRALDRFRLSRESWDRVLKSFRGITEGTKELKTHRKRRNALMQHKLLPAAEHQRDHNIGANTIYAVVNSWGQVLFFILIGLILFVFPDHFALASETSSGYVLAILYMLTPLDLILNAVPGLGRAVVAMDKVEELGLSLEAATQDGGDQPVLGPGERWHKLELRGVTHSYYREDADDTFTLGPIDLSFDRGELVFIVGGNGSGKTTLAKLVLGLYCPEEGEVVLDDNVVSDENRDDYRQLFTAIFSDFFLFETLLGLDHQELDEQAKSYLAKLHLQGKVEVQDGELSTIDLSQGQRKRLALLTAYLEDREIYLFDEWAADQDPQFKAIFYEQLLPELRDRGKTVLIISHDDRYFGVAERIVKLEYGQIVFDGPTEELVGATAVGAETAGVSRRPWI